MRNWQQWFMVANWIVPTSAIGLLVGVILSPAFKTSITMTVVLGILLFTILMTVRAIKILRSQNIKTLMDKSSGNVTKSLVSACFVIFLVIGLLLPTRNQEPYQLLYDSQVSFEAIVRSDAEYRSAYQRFYVLPKPGSFDLLENNNLKVLVSTDTFQDFTYGDEIQISGKLESIKNFTGDSGRAFAYREYLQVRGVSARIPFANVTKEGIYQPSLRRKLAELKGHYLSILNNKLSEPYSSLAGGITVGANDAMGQVREELFRRVGLTHIVVLSGYNVAIIVIALGSILAFLPYWVALIASVAGIWLFVILVGASTTIVRAGLMATAAVVSRLYGSELQGLTLLSLAVILMVLHNPMIVRFDPSFQLSVLATLGIIVVTPIIEPYFQKIPAKFGLREIIMTTLATQITVVPWIIYLIGDFSLVSPLANVLVLPIVPWAMLGSLLIYLTNPLWSLGIFSLLPVSVTAATHGMLKYVFVIAEYLGNWKLSSISLPPISLLITIISYALIAALLYKLHLVNKSRDLDKSITL